MILKGYLFSIGYAFACLLLSLIAYKLGLPKKYTRKLVHILVGFEWVILYHFFGAGWHFLAVCVLFTVILAISYRCKLMPMISSDSDNAPGTVYYGIAMSVGAVVGMFIPQIMEPFGIGIMCTSIGDGTAGVVGQLIRKHNPKLWGKKSLFGCLANYITSFLSASLVCQIYGTNLSVAHCLAIALLSVELELITPFGLDNISITWGITAFAYFLVNYRISIVYILPILLTVPVIMFVLNKQALTKGGLAVAILLDVIVSVSFGNFGFIMLCAFFFGSLLIDKLKRKAKEKQGSDEGLKGDKRDAMQVMANGAVAGICALVALFSSSALLFLGFSAVLAEALADTAASGFGAFSGATIDPFRLKKCKNGLSGGMSLIGTLASLVGAFAVSAIAFAFKRISFEFFWICAGAAFLGGIFDSFLGSLLQVKYKCVVCDRITEKHTHHGESTVKYSGFEFFDNDTVNLLSGCFAVFVAVLLGSLISF